MLQSYLIRGLKTGTIAGLAYGIFIASIGTGLVDPTPDYASIAEAMGVTGYGPVEDPDGLPAVLREAWETVEGGRPALVDVVCEPR
jgi:thiamine pyrophosphate-dependent acetolactate synthase large subunit-like protein